MHWTVGHEALANFVCSLVKKSRNNGRSTISQGDILYLLRDSYTGVYTSLQNKKSSPNDEKN